jgi:hypothetical protein
MTKAAGPVSPADKARSQGRAETKKVQASPQMCIQRMES